MENKIASYQISKKTCKKMGWLVTLAFAFFFTLIPILGFSIGLIISYCNNQLDSFFEGSTMEVVSSIASFVTINLVVWLGGLVHIPRSLKSYLTDIYPDCISVHYRGLDLMVLRKDIVKVHISKIGSLYSILVKDIHKQKLCILYSVDKSEVRELINSGLLFDYLNDKDKEKIKY